MPETKLTFLQKLKAAEERNRSMLCVGLDPDPKKFPLHMRGDARNFFDFCARIVDATADLVIAFKPQLAYFAANRAERQLERLMAYMRRNAPGVPVILDGKFGDIGNTAEQYAIAAFERYGADAVTLSPFMGFDTLEPYLKYHGKGALVLCHTSNKGSSDIQDKQLWETLFGHDPHSHHTVSQLIAIKAKSEWNTNGQMGLVVGATFPRELAQIRQLAPWLPILVPGVGAQGGDAHAVVKAAWRHVDGETIAPIIVNSSRSVLYASEGSDFAVAARREALRTRAELQAAKTM